MAKKKTTTKKEYVALVGFNYGKENTRIEKGDKVAELPSNVEKDLLTQNAIKEV